MPDLSKDVVELKKHVKQLQTANNEKNEQDIIAILNILKTEFSVTEQILRESKAGLAVGKLRTNESTRVSNLAKEIVKKWKTAVDKQKQHGATSPATHAPPKPSVATSGGPSALNGRPSLAGGTPTTPTSSGPPRSSKTDGVTGNTGDKTRDKCIELIYDALACDSPSPTDVILKRASEVEKAVYANHGGISNDYRQKIRSLFVNLKDKNNPGLRESVVSLDILPEKFVVMTSEEMASEEQKAATKKIKEENLFKSLAAQETEAETDAFQCGKCKQRKCRYRQAQTRSADEPMTTFVTCVACGNRWKFS